MTEIKEEPRNVGASLETKSTTFTHGSNDNIGGTVLIRHCPHIPRDVYNHLPALYRSAINVMARNGRCTIEAGK